MAKLLITTQTYENYGAHDWDGVGECPQYWKAKGGSDYVVKKVNVNKVTETVIDFRLVKDDYLTEFEQSQLEYEGKITYPAKELAW